MLVNVVGYAVDEFAGVIERLDDAAGVDGFELNVSCPNVKAGGLEFGADPRALAEVVARARAATRRPAVREAVADAPRPGGQRARWPWTRARTG